MARVVSCVQSLGKHHTRQGARMEAGLKFVEPATLADKAQQQLLDVCYGLGYNTAAALSKIWAVNPSCRVEPIGLELDPSPPALGARSCCIITGFFGWKLK